jgi:DNA-binding winged helix-turn-helix (wHTH) protein
MIRAYRFGNCVLQPALRRLLVAGRPVPLGGRAFDMLVALVERNDRVVTKDELLDVAWRGADVGDNNLQVQVFALRRYLGRHAIETIPRHGYRFALDVSADSPASVGITDCGKCPPLHGSEDLGDGHLAKMTARARLILQAMRSSPDMGFQNPHVADCDGLEVALELAVRRGRADATALIAEALVRIDASRNAYGRMRERMNRAHEMLPTARDAATRARLWTVVAFSRHTPFPPAPKLLAHRNEVAAWLRVGDRGHLYEALARQAIACGSAGRFSQARAALAEAASIEEAGWEPARRLALAFARATVAAYDDGPGSFSLLVDDEERLARQAGSSRFLGNVNLYRAEAALNLARPRDALRIAERILGALVGRESSLGHSIASAIRCQALVALDHGADAASAAREALAFARPNGRAAWFLDILALASARRGRERESAALLGFADAHYREIHEIRRAQDRRCADEAQERNRARLGRQATWIRRARAVSPPSELAAYPLD